jgi:hypothetical protein
MNNTPIRRLAAAAALALLTACAGCTMQDQEVPPLTGPSELSLSLSITATPDIITQDGSSQSVIVVAARDASAQPVANLPLRVDMTVNGVLTSDFGRLSAQTVSTGSDGRATVVYTAPPPPPDLNDPEPLIRFYVTPIGSNFDNSNSRSVSILLVRPAVALVPGAPFAEFTYSPSSPRVGGQVQFIAQLSSDPGGFIVSYEWDYGDGDRESGITQSHDFTAAGDYQVTLTVTDDSGLKASRTRVISVQ